MSLQDISGPRHLSNLFRILYNVVSSQSKHDVNFATFSHCLKHWGSRIDLPFQHVVVNILNCSKAFMLHGLIL